MPEWPKVERYLNFIGLFLLLVFLVVVPIPVAGYLAGMGALASVIFFSFRRRQLLLAAGSIGSIVLASFLYGPSLLLLGLWAAVIIPGTLFGGLLASGIPAGKAFTVGLLASALIAVLMFWMQRDLILQALESFHKWMQSGITAGGTAENAVSESSNGMTAVLNTMIKITRRLLPSLLALSAVMQLFVAAVFLFLLLKSAGGFAPSFGSFIFWKMPFNYIYLIGFFMVMRLVGPSALKIAADNFLLFIGIIYAVFGFSVMEYYLRRIKLSVFLKVVFYFGFVLLYLPGLVLAAAVGIFDSYFDFRQVKAKLIG
jgi:uncharacterized protein YybS (DUF2232 family)